MIARKKLAGADGDPSKGHYSNVGRPRSAGREVRARAPALVVLVLVRVRVSKETGSRMEQQ